MFKCSYIYRTWNLHQTNDMLWQNSTFKDFQKLEKYRNSMSFLMVLLILLLFRGISSAAIQTCLRVAIDINLNKILNIRLTFVPFIVEAFGQREYHTSVGNFAISCLTKYYDCLVVMLLLVPAISGTVSTNIVNFK